MLEEKREFEALRDEGDNSGCFLCEVIQETGEGLSPSMEIRQKLYTSCLICYFNLYYSTRFFIRQLESDQIQVQKQTTYSKRCCAVSKRCCAVSITHIITQTQIQICAVSVQSVYNMCPMKHPYDRTTHTHLCSGNDPSLLMLVTQSVTIAMKQAACYVERFTCVSFFFFFQTVSSCMSRLRDQGVDKDDKSSPL